MIDGRGEDKKGFLRGTITYLPLSTKESSHGPMKCEDFSPFPHRSRRCPSRRASQTTLERGQKSADKSLALPRIGASLLIDYENAIIGWAREWIIMHHRRTRASHTKCQKKLQTSERT
ncbi:hypothetical protein FOVG_09450 [Fusarium oxysporum f. sp. pisi HDV247]|uniref:Uncharacterized protein n=1 Tax=Fusarium oxysporum f. sp. pisi HDV247 TaxID=1080344 RepID=W9PCJ6_FUSOX|nr:hypothetical protein FOVG_09450 [Fusarium oxysporum f. sp. pisi HDV247]